LRTAKSIDAYGNLYTALHRMKKAVRLRTTNFVGIKIPFRHAPPARVRAKERQAHTTMAFLFLSVARSAANEFSPFTGRERGINHNA
jgi:hypothetical protein